MQKRIKIIIPVFYCLSSTHLVYANGNDKYVLDDSLFKNQSSETIKLLQKISDDEYSPGLYNVDIYVNGKYIDRQEIKFTEVNDSGVKPCFDNQVLKKIGISKKILENINESQESCIFLSDYLEVNVDFNFSNLKLNLSIAQNDLVNLPRGYTDPELWNSGSSILFLNYIASAYHSSIDSDFGNQKQTSGFLSINGGINFENWQYRQQSNLNYNKGGETTWNNTRSYLTRPIEKIQGNVLLGQTYTSGRFFSGLRFTGLNVSSDERMLPQSMRGYAPTIQGIAKSNAKVSIFQNNRIIYETSVAAGAFVINDLYPTSYNGNLLVKVEEADGSISEFTVPFSSVPQSLRTGAFKYNIDAGKTKDIGDDSYFSDASIQYGLNNKITLISGLRISDDYYAGLFGGTYTEDFGTLGSTITYSYADNVAGKSLSGWMANLNYSKTFTPTQTTLTLAGYRYSTDNYRDLNDVLEQRYATNNNQTGTYSDAYRQRSRFDLTMNQILGSYGTIFLSGSISNYHYRSDKNIQAQLGYSKSFKNGVNLNLAVVKQYYDTDNNNSLSDKYNYFNYTSQRKSETSFSLSVNIPLNLGRKKGGNNFSLSYLNNAEHTNSYQAAFSGYQGKVNPLNYSLGASYDDQSKNTMFNGSLGKRFTYANTGLNASVSDNYWQVGGNLQGALAIHSGGITLGQYLSETFALVEAKGAQGAEVNNSQGTKIDRFGYALIPSLTPYQANTVSINPVGTSYFLDIEASKDQVVPYAGAAVKVKFKTQMGYPLLIQVKRESGEYIPLGSTILNEQGKVLGIAGQNGQMYIRTEKEQGRLTITWGDTDHEKCHIGYAIPANVEEQPFISLSGVCIEDNK